MRIEAEAMDGRWFKTNASPQWIDSLDVETIDGETFVHIRGSAAPSPADWGRVRAETVYASKPDTTSALAGGFIAHYAFDAMHVEVQANLNLGLLVVATYINFEQPAAHADRFTREFFFRSEA